MSETLEMPLEINTTLVNKYTDLVSTNIDTIPEAYRVMHELAIMTLESKQCNEPYEKLLTELLDWTLNP